MNSHVFPSLIRRFVEAKENNYPSVTCWGSGKSLREFLHVNDLADACIFLLRNWDPGSINAPKNDLGDPLTLINIGTGKDISIYELATKVAYLTGYKGEIIWDKSKPDGTPKKQLDVSRINQMGWKSKVSLTDGIKETILDFKKEIKSNVREF